MNQLDDNENGLAGVVTSGSQSTFSRLTLKSKGLLYAHFISIFERGGVFIPSKRTSTLGERIMMIVTLPENTRQYTLVGKIALISPEGGARPQGFGVHFNPGAAEVDFVRDAREILGPAASLDPIPGHVTAWG